jgi:nicotinate-nucleotide adenylyltransferase
MDIALFGTSGDPPTIGHRAILQWLSPRFNLVVVWVSHNPFKSHHASLEQRISMMELTISSLKEDLPGGKNVQLHPEVSNPHTLVTVNQAKQIWQNANFTLVIGADIVNQMPSWYRVSELLSQVELLVIPRQGYDIADSAIQTLESYGTKLKIAELTVPISSSTEFRQKGESANVIPAVTNYIEQESLYIWQEAKPHH